MRYQSQEYLVLPDGTLRPLSSPSDMDTVIGFGMSLVFMVMVTGLMKSLILDALEPQKSNSQLLSHTIKYRVASVNHLATLPATNAESTTESEAAESWLSRLLKTETVMAVPSDWRWLLSDNHTLKELDLLPTTEATENKVEGILKQLKAGVESIQQSDQFRLFLSTMGKFHDYSIGNMILIMLQKPQAIHVAGFNTWKELGRWVKSGEKGIAIFAPVFPPAATCGKCGVRVPRSAKYCPKCGEEVNLGEEMAATPRHFRVVYVFERS